MDNQELINEAEKVLVARFKKFSEGTLKANPASKNWNVGDLLRSFRNTEMQWVNFDRKEKVGK